MVGSDYGLRKQMVTATWHQTRVLGRTPEQVSRKRTAILAVPEESEQSWRFAPPSRPAQYIRNSSQASRHPSMEIR